MPITQLQLRKTTISDLETLFQFQLDEEANRLAAFTSKANANKETYIEKYTKILSDPTTNNHTILLGDVIAGSIAKFEIEGDAEITYWISRRFWRQGIATAALEMFLKIEKARPLYGRVAFDNTGSQKVLEKCGFIKTGTDKGFANARQAEIEEYIYQLPE